jgi:Uri superfamily endonuclease
MEARIARHFSKMKRLRWHIDYLLGPHAKVVGVELFDREECAVNQNIEGDLLVPGFGSTDCKSKCGSHLKYLGQVSTTPSNWKSGTCSGAEASVSWE